MVYTKIFQRFKRVHLVLLTDRVLIVMFYLSDSFSGLCYMCEDFNSNGQGFMEHPNETMCCYYYECWRVDGSTVLDQILRTCPPGTWFNSNAGHRGAPCTANKPFPHCVSECGTSEPITSECMAAKTDHLYNTCTLLDQRRRRCADGVRMSCD